MSFVPTKTPPKQDSEGVDCFVRVRTAIEAGSRCWSSSPKYSAIIRARVEASIFFFFIAVWLCRRILTIRHCINQAIFLSVRRFRSLLHCKSTHQSVQLKFSGTEPNCFLQVHVYLAVATWTLPTNDTHHLASTRDASNVRNAATERAVRSITDSFQELEKFTTNATLVHSAIALAKLACIIRSTTVDQIDRRLRR